MNILLHLQLQRLMCVDNNPSVLIFFMNKHICTCMLKYQHSACHLWFDCWCGKWHSYADYFSLKCHINTSFFLKRHLFLIMGSRKNLQPHTDTSSLQMSRKREILRAKRQSTALTCNCSSSDQMSGLGDVCVLRAEALAWLQSVAALLSNSISQALFPC